MGWGAGAMAGIAGANTIIGGYAAYKNYKAEQNKLKWDKQVQETTWQREDTATQRKVADLKAAGLSPVLAAGQGASSGPIVSTVAPKVGVPDLMQTAAIWKQLELADKQIDQTDQQIRVQKAQEADTYMQVLERMSRMEVNNSQIDRNRSIVAQLPSIIRLNNANTRRAAAGAQSQEYETSYNAQQGVHPRPSAGGAFFRDMVQIFRRGLQSPPPQPDTRGRGATGSWE